MRGFGLCLVGLALLMAACTRPELPPASPTPTITTPVEASASASPATVPARPESPAVVPLGSPTFCPGRTWPPYPLGGIVGITAVSTDRQTIEITNRTDRTWYYSVAGWQVEQFETCSALGEFEVVRGPIAPGTTERVTVDQDWWRMGVPVTVGFREERCGEGCNREPIAAVVVELSPAVPIAS